MTLREQLDGDQNLFFDLEEMATAHSLKVGGAEREIYAIVDEQGGQINSLKAPGGIYDGDLLFYAKTSDLAGIVRGGAIQWDGVPFRVTAIVDEDGISQVTLSAGTGGY